MAKQIKKVIDERTAKLKALGYELVPESKGAYQTVREVDRLTIERKDIEYMDDHDWSFVMVKVEADHTKHLPLTEAETIQTEEPDANANKTLVPTMDSAKDILALRNNPLVKAIANFEKEYKGLTFSGLEDKTGIEKIKAAKKVVQKTRTWITKTEDALKAPYIRGSKDIKAVADEFRAMIAPVEDPLDAEIDRFKMLQEEDEKRKEIEAEKEGTKRVELLKEAGMKFMGQFYEIGETISMDYASIKAMTAEEFEKLLGKVDAEKKRLDELEAKELEQLKDQRKITRANMLGTLGMVLNYEGNWVIDGLPELKGVKVLRESLTDEPDDKFMALFSSLGTRINDAKNKSKEEEDKAAKERTLKTRTRLLLSIGLDRVDWIPGTTQTGFYFKNDFVECKLPLPELEAKDDDTFDHYLEVVEGEIREAKAKAIKKEDDDAKAQKLASERREQLVALGMTRAPQLSCFIFNTPDVATQCSVAYGELTGQSPETWEVTIKDVTATIAKIKEDQQAFETKAAKDKKDKEDKENADKLIFQERQYKIVNLGMAIVGNTFTVKNEFGDVANITIEEVKAIDPDTWPRRLSEVVEAIDEVKKKTATKRQEAIDAAEALKPQVTKFREYLASFIDITAPDITEAKLEGIMTTFKEDLGNIIIKANKALEQVNN